MSTTSEQATTTAPAPTVAKKRAPSSKRSDSNSKSKSKSKSKTRSASKSSHSKGGKSKSKNGKAKTTKSGKNDKHKTKVRTVKSSSSTSASKKSRDSGASSAPKRTKVSVTNTVLPATTVPKEDVRMRAIADKSNPPGGIKLEMRRAPFRALLKESIVAEQKKHPSLNSKEKSITVRMHRDVPKAVQAEIENWTKDQLKLLAIAARHGKRNTINAQDVELISTMAEYYQGSVESLTRLKRQSAIAASERAKKREEAKLRADGKDTADPSAPKSSKKSGKGKKVVDTEKTAGAGVATEMPALVAA